MTRLISVLGLASRWGSTAPEPPVDMQIVQAEVAYRRMRMARRIATTYGGLVLGGAIVFMAGWLSSRGQLSELTALLSLLR